ncbi:MAG TPA: TRAM domain-containing protein, partial [Candidatus Methylomirabilis sp.]
FDHLGAFAYSREEGTPAARMKAQVPQGVKAGRVQQVMEAQAAISREKNRALVGSRQRVLIDKESSAATPLGKGRTSRQAPEIDGAVYVKNSKEARGEWAEVKIIEADTYDLVGECLV